jgi:hypothetical protein
MDNQFALLWLTVGVVSCGALSASAQTVRESFDGAGYSAGATVSGRNGGTGFTEPWVEQGAASQFDRILAGSLTYPGFTSAGNSASSVPPPDYYSAPFRRISPISGSNGSTLWVAYLFRKNSHTTLGAPVVEDYFGLVLYGSGSQDGVLIGDSYESANFALGTAGQPSAGAEISSVPITLDTTALLLARIDFLAGADRIQLFVNPNIAAGEPTLASATKNNLDLGNITALGMLAGYDAVYSYDEIVLGPTFASIFGGGGGPTPPNLRIATRPDGSVEVTYQGVLESRPAVNTGAWTTVSGSSPLVISRAQLERARFYRARQP